MELTDKRLDCEQYDQTTPLRQRAINADTHISLVSHFQLFFFFARALILIPRTRFTFANLPPAHPLPTPCYVTRRRLQQPYKLQTSLLLKIAFFMSAFLPLPNHPPTLPTSIILCFKPQSPQQIAKISGMQHQHQLVVSTESSAASTVFTDCAVTFNRRY